MNNNMYLEKNSSQKPAIELLEKLGYKYISPAECRKQRNGLYNVILRDILRSKLVELNSYSYGGTEYKFSNENIERAVNEIDEPLADNLVASSEKVYDDLMLGRGE